MLPAATTTPAELTAANVTLGSLSRTSELAGPVIAALLLAGDDGPGRVFALMGVVTLIAALAVARPGFDRALLHARRDVDAG